MPKLLSITVGNLKLKAEKSPDGEKVRFENIGADESDFWGDSLWTLGATGFLTPKGVRDIAEAILFAVDAMFPSETNPNHPR